MQLGWKTLWMAMSLDYGVGHLDKKGRAVWEGAGGGVDSPTRHPFGGLGIHIQPWGRGIGIGLDLVHVEGVRAGGLVLRHGVDLPWPQPPGVVLRVVALVPVLCQQQRQPSARNTAVTKKTWQTKHSRDGV